MRRAFSAIELILCLAIIAILAGIATVGIRKFNEMATDKAAISKAQALDAAKQSYRDRLPNATATWETLASDTARFADIVNRGCLPLAAGKTWTVFLNEGTPTSKYTYTLNAIDVPVKVVRGSVVLKQ